MALPKRAGDYVEDLTTGIVPIICEVMSETPGCNVVDLGAGLNENCMILASHGARVYLDTTDDTLRSKVVETEDLESSDVDALLAYCPDTVDIVLCWDILDYLSLDSIQHIINRFGKAMRPGGLLYAMTSQRRHIPGVPPAIQLVAEDHLRFHYDPSPDKEGHSYAAKQLEYRMPGFVVEKLYLLQNGIQEHLFLFEGID